MDSSDSEHLPFYKRIHFFPMVSDNKLDIKEFLDATADLILVVDRLGRVFAPVKSDMQGNLDRIVEGYDCNEGSCLLSEINNEIQNGSPRVADGVVWLNRSILFFEIMFKEILKHIKRDNIDVPMKNLLNVAYEGSIKQYHSWVTQQLFRMICRMSPKLPQIFNSLEVDSVNEFEIILSNYIISLTSVRCALDNVFRTHNLY